MNCVADIAYQCFMAAKNLYGKANGIFFYQYVQPFSPQERITPDGGPRDRAGAGEKVLSGM